jgi:hypothetical protein
MIGFDVACNVHALSSLPPIHGASLHDMVRNPHEAGMCINTTLASSRSDVFSFQAPTLATRLRVILRLPGCWMAGQTPRQVAAHATPSSPIHHHLLSITNVSLLQLVMCSIPDVTTETQVVTFQDKTASTQIHHFVDQNPRNLASSTTGFVCALDLTRCGGRSRRHCPINEQHRRRSPLRGPP